MPLTLATWNINSVRLRAPIVQKLMNEHSPDVLCLQETKCPDPLFPHEAFESLGYKYQLIRGEKGYNGVAILSRVPISAVDHTDFVSKGDTRHVAGQLENGTVIHNIYLPAGGDEPDREKNVKFGHKLDFLSEMTELFTKDTNSRILVGDLNIAPLETDVWSHKKLLKVVSHTPIEVDRFNACQEAGNWTDITRKHLGNDDLLYSWWSYRAKDWLVADKGRRLDHIWAHGAAETASSDSWILKDARGWEKPSDHAPVFAKFDF